MNRLENGTSLMRIKRALLPLSFITVLGTATVEMVGCSTEEPKPIKISAGSMEYCHPLEGYQNGVFVANNAIVVRIDKKDSIIYVKVPGQFGETSVKEQADERMQDIDKFTGAEVGFKIEDDTPIDELTHDQNGFPYKEVGYGMETLLDSVEVGDQIPMIDAILTNPDATEDQKTEMEKNKEALSQLENGTNSTPPVFETYVIVLE